MLKSSKVEVLESSSQLDDLLAFEGDDLCIFMFSTSISDNLNKLVVEQFTDLATEVRRNTKRMRFIGYDLNMLGPHKALDLSHPTIWLAPGASRDKPPRLYRGNSVLEEAANWLKKHADNKFKMNTENLD